MLALYHLSHHTCRINTFWCIPISLHTFFAQVGRLMSWFCGLQLLHESLRRRQADTAFSRSGRQAVQTAGLACMAALLGCKPPQPALSAYLCRSSPSGQQQESTADVIVDLLDWSEEGGWPADCPEWYWERFAVHLLHSSPCH